MHVRVEHIDGLETTYNTGDVCSDLLDVTEPMKGRH